MLALVVIALWLLLIVARLPAQADRVNCRDGVKAVETSCTFASFQARDPYCLIDPTCLSPIVLDDSSSSWRGTAVVGDPSLVSTQALTMLALPNFVLFATLYFAIAAWRRGGPTVWLATSLWYSLELFRWLTSVWRQFSLELPAALSVSNVAALAALASPLLLVVWCRWRAGIEPRVA